MWFIALYIKDAKFAFWATQRVFWPKVKKADPQFWGSLLSSLCLKNASELRFLHVKVEPKTPSHCPRVDQKKFFSLKFGFNLPNFTTLGGCPLKNWTFVQKLVSYWGVIGGLCVINVNLKKWISETEFLKLNF